LVNLTYAHDFAAMSLLASFSQIDREFKNREDITDGSPLIFGDLGILPGPAFSNELVDLDDETIEIRLTSSSDSNLQWLIGYYRKDAVADAGYRMAEGWIPLDVYDAAIMDPGPDPDRESPSCLGQDGVLDVYFNGLANTQKLQEYEEEAVFGEVTYNFNDSFSITAGIRAFDYDFHSLEENWGWAFNSDGDRSTANVRDAVISDSDTNEKLTLTYHYSDDSQVYLTGATGSRPGAINRVIPRSTDSGEAVGFACNNDLIALGIDDPSEYAGDEVTSIEFGWKTTFNDSVRLNAAVYDVTWDNIQQLVLTSAICGNNFTGNLGEAGSTGLELELTAAVSDNLTFTFGLGLVDAQFNETILSPDDVAIVSKGDKLTDVPATTFNVGFDYTIPASSGEYYVLGNWNFVDDTLEVVGHRSDDVSGPGIDSGNERPKYSIVDLRTGYISESGWEVSLFADNLFDETAIYGYNDAIAFAFSPADPTVRNKPRTVGVSALWRF
jgi:outer membrane receptor for monomeric catechols